MPASREIYRIWLFPLLIAARDATTTVFGRSAEPGSNVVGRESQEIHSSYVSKQQRKAEADPVAHQAALRTAFVARFIVLREGRRSRAHRIIENMCWEETTSAEELAQRIRQAFVENGDKLQPVDRDLRRALEHARCSVGHFADQYFGRSTRSFAEALEDYERSNRLLFGDDAEEMPRSGGWRVGPPTAGHG